MTAFKWQTKEHINAVLILLIAIPLDAISTQSIASHKPHIIIILADDLGFDDVSFRGSNRFLTPNIDALAFSGIVLKNLYTPAMCTPSRAALLTGKYPINTGMQHYVIVNDQPWGLPLNEKTMADIFKAGGYYTSIIGKWHLGMSQRNFTPTFRGFDHHLGYLGAYVDYYDQTYIQMSNAYTGHDFKDNLQVSREYVGQYMTDLLTDAAVKLIESHNATDSPLFLLLSHLAPHGANANDPMQVPEEELAHFSYIRNETHRRYAAMVSRLDKSVEKVIETLAACHFLQDSIVLFLSDNGGPTQGMHSTTASNFPLRGQKNSPWEGGVRSSGAIWSPELKNLGSVSNQRFYIADFLPTLASAAGIDLDPNTPLDGLNFWPALKYGYKSMERDIVHNIDDLEPYLSYTRGKWKIVHGTTSNGEYDGWLGKRPEDEIDPRAVDYDELVQHTKVWQFLSGTTKRNISALRHQSEVTCSKEKNRVQCLPLQAPCLFDIDEDPCEQNNLYDEHGNAIFVAEMWQRIEQYRLNSLAPGNKPSDPNCDPQRYENEWTWWKDKATSASTTALNKRNEIISDDNLQ